MKVILTVQVEMEIENDFDLNSYQESLLRSNLSLSETNESEAFFEILSANHNNINIPENSYISEIKLK